MKYPALDIPGIDSGMALAAVDEYRPTAADDRGDSVLIFFATAAARDSARHVLANQFPHTRIESLDVDDEDWARRSQGDLQPVTIGRLTLVAFITRAGAPPPALPFADASQRTARHGRRRSDAVSKVLIIPASTGFGTGHHASTRLCLQAMQQIDLTGKRVLDLGTGSGVLALAARALGAREAHGVDDDPDAIRAARENLALNPGVNHVTFDVADLRALLPASADVITANLTGALLTRTAALISSHLAPGGVLIASGVMAGERDTVVAAFHTLSLRHEAAEDGWVGLRFERTA